eukprot:403350100
MSQKAFQSAFPNISMSQAFSPSNMSSQQDLNIKANQKYDSILNNAQNYVSNLNMQNHQTQSNQNPQHNLRNFNYEQNYDDNYQDQESDSQQQQNYDEEDGQQEYGKFERLDSQVNLNPQFQSIHSSDNQFMYDERFNQIGDNQNDNSQMQDHNDNGSNQNDYDQNTFNQVHFYPNGVSKEINLSNLKTSQLIGNYQNLLSDMKSQISTIKGKFQIKNNLINTKQQSIERIQQQQDNDLNQQDTLGTLSNGMNTQSTYGQLIASPVMKILDTQKSRVTNKNLMSHDENLLESYQSFRAIQVQNQNAAHQHNQSVGDGGTFSPHIPKQSERRVTELHHGSLQRVQEIEERNKRRILSSLNLRKSPQNNDAHALISTSSNYKFTNTSMGSPNSPKNYIYSPYSLYQSRFDLNNQNNKENMNLQNQKAHLQNSNSPMNLQHLHIANNKPQQDYETMYYDQVKMNKQLIDQVKSLKIKADQAQNKASKDFEVKLIKSIQNEEHLQQKNNQLMLENQGLLAQLNEISMQIEGSMRNNQELETYLENCEVSQAKFTDKYKSYNKKIQDLNKRNLELRDINVQLEDKVKNLETEKLKLSEKWIRLSARQRVEDKNKSRVREKEVKIEKIEKQLELAQSKAEQFEKQNLILKDENAAISAKLNQIQKSFKDASSLKENLENEKYLADKVTNELLARIQRYEAQINEQQEQINQVSEALQFAQKDQEEMKLIEQDMQNMQDKMNQINSESIEIQTYNMQLESENQKMQSELIVQRDQIQIKDQQIDTLQLQLEHQVDQFKELQSEFSEVIEQLQKKENVLNIKFSQEELQDAADYLIGQIQLDSNNLENNQQLDSSNIEDQTITCLIVKAAQKIKYLNKYHEGFKLELEELTEKYDKLAIKYRDSNKEAEHLSNLKEVLQVQVENQKSELGDLKQYIFDLESMMKSDGNLDNNSQQMNHFQETFSAASVQDRYMQQLQTFERSPSIMHMYASQDQNNMSQDLQEDPNIYQSMNSQQAKTLKQLHQYQQHQNSVDSTGMQRNSLKYLEKIADNKKSLNNLSSIQHSYDHSRVCLPTRLLSNQQISSTFIANKLKVNQSLSSISNEKNDVSLQEQIKNTLQQYKNQQHNQRASQFKGTRGISNSKSGKKSSIIQKIGDRNERQAQQKSLSRSPLSTSMNGNNDQQYADEAYYSQRAVSSTNNLYINPNMQHQIQTLHSVRQSQSQATNLLSGNNNGQGRFSQPHQQTNAINNAQNGSSTRGNSGNTRPHSSSHMRSSINSNMNNAATQAAQKHKLIKEYNQDRDQKQELITVIQYICRWEDYQETKKMKKTQLGQDPTQTQMPSYEEQMDGNYKKIHKILAVNNKNKDVREEIKDHLNERPENQLSPGMWLTLNPQYSLNQNMKSTFKDDFKGDIEEPVDKIYFRRRDEASQYAEFLFKSKVVLTKK